MLTATFQLGSGVGPRRERQLWQAGIAHWTEYSAGSARLARAADAALQTALAEAMTAFEARDLARLAALLPGAEHWRLFEAFGADAAYLDIETSDDAVGRAFISAIAIVDRAGPRWLSPGRDLDQFPELARRWSLLVSFNGLSFDVPILQRAFPDWQPPPVHLDLRHLLARLGLDGGLKAIERRLPSLHLARPDRLAGLDGGNAGWLFRRGRDGDREALRLFAEYNLYDAISLRTLMAHAYNTLVEQHAARYPALRARIATVPVPGRGDVTYDVSKILLAL